MIFIISGNTGGDKKDNAWFGVSVISTGYKGFVMVSEPSYCNLSSTLK